MRRATIALAVAAFVLQMTAASAQPADPQERFALLGQFTGATSSEFSGSDLGGGALVAWHVTDFVGAEAEVNFYPTSLTARGGAPFSSGRTEGLFGVSVGPALGRLRPFGTLRMGFV
jgi:hypothetical protein